MLRSILHVSAEGRGHIPASQHPQILLADAAGGKKIINTSIRAVLLAAPREEFWEKTGAVLLQHRLQRLTDGPLFPDPRLFRGERPTRVRSCAALRKKVQVCRDATLTNT